MFPLSGILLILVVACGSEGSVASSTGSDPPFVTDGPVLAPQLVEILEPGPAKEFPDELLPHSEPLAADRVTQLLREFLPDSYAVDVTGAVTEFCMEGTGSRLGLVTDINFEVGRCFEELRAHRIQWRVERPSGEHAWYEPSRATGDSAATLSTPSDGLSPGWSVSTTKLAVFENPRCGEVLVDSISPLVPVLLEVDRIKDFDQALMPDSEPLPEDEVIRLWTEYWSDTMMIVGGLVMEFCRDSSARILVSGGGNPAGLGVRAEWGILPNHSHA